MNKLLTTVTPYWGRPEILSRWLRCLKVAKHPSVKHLVMFVGGLIPDWVRQCYGDDTDFHFVCFAEHTPGERSIGFYHNWAAKEMGTEWIMKLDSDALVNPNYFSALVPLLLGASPREWFNGGMFYLQPHITETLFQQSPFLTVVGYSSVLSALRDATLPPHVPAASNFICRRQDYLSLGGCDEHFQGYGWEDYQQIFMLEHYQLGKSPLGSSLDLRTITQRCREEISRRKAAELHKRSPWLCLLHHWHSTNTSPIYRNSGNLNNNRRILFEYCRKLST